jgi:hypothetical protein
MNIKKVASVIFLLTIGCFVIFSQVSAQQVIIPFEVGQTLIHNVNTTQSTRTYQIMEREDSSVFILAVAQDYTSSPAMTLLDNETNRIAGMMNLDISGMCLRLAPGNSGYTLTVVAEDAAAGAQIYGLELLEDEPTAFSCNDLAMASLASATNAATLDSTNANLTSLTDGFFGDDDGNDVDLNNPNGANNPGGCQAASDSSIVGVNIRSLADQSSSVIGNIGVGDIVPVLGIVDGTDFLLVDNGDALGFASNQVIQLGGDCTDVPLVETNGSSVLGTGDTIDLGNLPILGDTDLLDPILGTGATDNVGDGFLDVDTDENGLNAQAGAGEDGILNVDAGEGGLNADAGTGDNDLLNLDAGEGGVDAQGGTDGSNLLDITVDENGVNAESTTTDTDVTVDDSGPTCPVVLGIPLGC